MIMKNTKHKIPKKKKYSKNPTTDDPDEIKTYLNNTVKNEIIVKLIFVVNNKWDLHPGLFGILDKGINKYYFQFNPLSQWRYQENARLPTTNNEHLASLEEDALFEHDKPTYELSFVSSEVYNVDIDNNIIDLYPWVPFEPKPIE